MQRRVIQIWILEVRHIPRLLARNTVFQSVRMGKALVRYADYTATWKVTHRESVNTSAFIWTYPDLARFPGSRFYRHFKSSESNLRKLNECAISNSSTNAIKAHKEDQKTSAISFFTCGRAEIS
jgi:hypothetical protein